MISTFKQTLHASDYVENPVTWQSTKKTTGKQIGLQMNVDLIQYVLYLYRDFKQKRFVKYNVNTRGFRIFLSLDPNT